MNCSPTDHGVLLSQIAILDSPPLQTSTPTFLLALPEPPLHPDLSCSFDMGFCSWRQMASNSFNWTRHKGPTHTADTGPSSNHTTRGEEDQTIAMSRSLPGDHFGLDWHLELSMKWGSQPFLQRPYIKGSCTWHMPWWQTANRRCCSFCTGSPLHVWFFPPPEGYFIYLQGHVAKEGDATRLASPFYTFTRPRCFSFWYRMRGAAQRNALRVYLAFEDGSRELIWSQSGNKGDRWHRGEVNMPQGKKAQVTETLAGDAPCRCGLVWP